VTTTIPRRGGTHSGAPGKKPSPRTISRDLLAAMRRTHPLEAAMATLLIQEGSWEIAGNDDESSENRDSRHAPAETCLSDSTRDRNVCGQLFAGKIY
jgi:hypothetical protein